MTAAPVLDWDDETDDLTPDFLVDFDEGDVVAGNEVALKIYSNAGLTHLVVSTTHELTAPEILAGTIDFGASALADNWTYYARVRVESGTWSNTETIVLGDGVSGGEPEWTLDPDAEPEPDPDAEFTSVVGAGNWPDRSAEDIKRRRKKAEELEEAIRRAAGLIPPDAPEGKAARDEVKKASILVEEAPGAKRRRAVSPPQVDLRPLIEAAQRVERSIKDYKARIAEERRRQEEDEEDILLLLADD